MPNRWEWYPAGDRRVNWLIASVASLCSFLPAVFGGTLLVAGLIAIWRGAKALWIVVAVFVAIFAYYFFTMTEMLTQMGP